MQVAILTTLVKNLTPRITNRTHWLPILHLGLQTLQPRLQTLHLGVQPLHTGYKRYNPG